MFCSSDYRCIFVHVPKTGGASINRTIKHYLKPAEVFGPRKIDMGIQPRRFAWEIKNRWASEQQWNEYFKFAYVRNPWDAIVSIFHNILQSDLPQNLTDVKEDKRILKRILVEYFDKQGKDLSFSNFVEHCVWANALDCRFSYHWKPQYLHVTDPEGNIILDFVARFESFDRDWEKIQAEIGLRVDLPRLNRSFHQAYREYYNQTLRDIVARRFERDIDLFGYQY